MIAEGYQERGSAALPGFLPAEVSKALVAQFMADLKAGTVKPGLNRRNPVLRRDALELGGNDYAPMRGFHWGLTTAMERLTGAALLPSSSYFRIYNRDDICRVHSDKEECEHSLTLTLDSGGDAPWSFEVATAPAPGALSSPAEDFGADDYVATPMRPGDAVLYRGSGRRHGRMTPNPNPWSAHMFLCWVERGGAFAGHAFGAGRSAG